MKFGLILRNTGTGSSREAIEAGAETVERLGWETVWTTDHVLVPRSAAVEYGRTFEAIATLAWVGARHPKLRLGASVIVVPQRNAVLLAKELATLDVLSEGRLIVGVGAGWNETEFANLGASGRFHRRGAYLDETIRLWRHLWSGSAEPFEGAFHGFSDFVFGPLPAQKDRVPIVVGGASEAALRRAGALGDGYHATRSGPEVLAGRIPTIRPRPTQRAVRCPVYPCVPPLRRQGPGAPVTHSPEIQSRWSATSAPSTPWGSNTWPSYSARPNRRSSRR